MFLSLRPLVHGIAFEVTLLHAMKTLLMDPRELGIHHFSGNES